MCEEEVRLKRCIYVRPLAESVHVGMPMSVMQSSSIYLRPVTQDEDDYWDVAPVEDQGEL